ncbi:hypothetical protein [Curtobacterium poinsettiae]|uniref:hypothetical protein n=1 Tax=Curtobacterium TaxID=2034 RepID=UPI00217CC6FC|nr:hypothetical protein [Curtobacterium flaccumfaciens]MCS6563439.1 hypothetical protein [Curtobacterium flaccumfaciens pv. poinsettiae]UXN27235.1 hypothetical protein N8D75_08840 [Curtobacterium flaccumfaciens]
MQQVANPFLSEIDALLGITVVMNTEELPDGFTASDVEDYIKRGSYSSDEYSTMRVHAALRNLVNEGFLDRKENGTYYRKDLTND